MVARLRYLVAMVALLWLLPGDLPALATASGYCDQVCNSGVPCDTYCNGPTAEHPWDMTCGEYDGGAANGWCESSCGDGVCDTGAGENDENCESDCVSDLPHLLRVRFPEWGPPWAHRQSNYPREQEVGNCWGNCGSGCSERSVCGSRFQYWELEIISGINQNTQEVCFCADNSNLYECGALTTYSATGRWTYYGWYADGCRWHDTTCRQPWWASFGFTLIGFIIAPGAGWHHLWVNIVFNPYSACKLSYSSFLLGGACQSASPQEWPYTLTVVTDEFQHDRYEYGPAGSCYSGPPTCGDGICQTNGCLLGEGEAGNAPGNGCEEDWSTCSSDCS